MDFVNDNDLYLSGNPIFGLSIYGNNEELMLVFIIMFSHQITIKHQLHNHYNYNFYTIDPYKNGRKYPYHIGVHDVTGESIYEPLYTYIREKTIYDVRHFSTPAYKRTTLYIKEKKDYDTILEYLNINNQTYLYQIKKTIS